MIIEEINGITKITANEGMLIADNEAIYGKEIWLGIDRTIDEFFEIGGGNNEDKF